MRLADAFRETLFRFRLKGTEIAERSGLPSTRISEFRNGKNIRIDNLEKILKALPKDARLYLLQLVAQDDDLEDETEASVTEDKDQK